MDVKEWSNFIAAMVVDALLDAQLVKKVDLATAIEIASVEILVRLSIDDYPHKD